MTQLRRIAHSMIRATRRPLRRLALIQLAALAVATMMLVPTVALADGGPMIAPVVTVYPTLFPVNNASLSQTSFAFVCISNDDPLSTAKLQVGDTFSFTFEGSIGTQFSVVSPLLVNSTALTATDFTESFSLNASSQAVLQLKYTDTLNKYFSGGDSVCAKISFKPSATIGSGQIIVHGPADYYRFIPTLPPYVTATTGDFIAAPGALDSVTAGTGLVESGASPNITLGIAPGGVTSNELASSAVTSAKLAQGAVMLGNIGPGAVTRGNIATGNAVTSLNAMTDAVTLVPGSGINIMPTPSTLNSLTITAPGSFAAGGDLAGTTSNQRVVGIQGVPVASLSVTGNFANMVLGFSGNTLAPVQGFIAGGDLFGTVTNQTVNSIQRIPFNMPANTGTNLNGTVLGWNGAAYAPTPGFSAGGDLMGSATNQQVMSLQGFKLSLGGTGTGTGGGTGIGPSAGQVLGFNGNAWLPVPSLNNRGLWTAANSYNVDDIVFDPANGSSWVALQAIAANTAGSEPSLTNVSWQLFAAQGATGLQGPKGDTGPQGLTGPIGPMPTGAAITTLPNTFSMDQTITGNLVIGGTGNGIKFADGTSLTTGNISSATGANSRMTASAFLPGALNTPYTAASFTPDFNITITHVSAQVKTAGDSSCTPAVLRVGNSTSAQDLVLSSSQSTFDSGAMSLPLPASGGVSVKLQAGASCSAGATPSDANVLVQYRAQGSGDTTSCASSGQVCASGGVGVCKLTQSDANNCGACGNVCPANGVCTNGSCSVAKSQVSADYFVMSDPNGFRGNSFPAGQSLTFVAALRFSTTNSLPSPTGSVTFSDTFNGVTTVLGTAPLSTTATGQTPQAGELFTQISTATLAAGNHTITAQYGGDTNYLGVSWAPPTLAIFKSQTTADFFAVSPTSPSAAQPVTLTAALKFPTTNGAPAPTGSVTFSDTFNGVTTVLGTAPLATTATGQTAQAGELYAQFSTTLAAGTHTITAQYPGDNNYLGVSWAPPSFTVGP